MKILFTSYAVPPVSSPGSMRIFNFAKYLSEQKGYTVEILHCPNAYSSMQDHDRKWDFGKIKLIPVADIFDKNKLVSNDELFNTSKHSVSKKIKIKVLKNMNNLVFPDKTITWAINVFRKKVLKNKYDYIISSYPDITNLIIGHYYSKLFKTPLIVDMRDLWAQDLEYSQKNYLRKRLESKIEFDILSKSHMILTVSEFNALQLSKVYGKKVEVIYNGFENDKFKECRLVNDVVYQENQTENSKFKMAYAGSFYNGERNVDKLFKAINSLKDKEIINKNNFCFDIYGRKEDYITQIVDKYQLSELVSVKGLVNQDALFKKLDGYNLLLVVTRNAEISKGELTTKVFEYIALGNPILCLAKADFEIVKLLDTIEYTYCVDMEDELSIEDTLKNIISNRDDAFDKRAFNLDFSRDSMSKKLKSLL